MAKNNNIAQLQRDMIGLYTMIYDEDNWAEHLTSRILDHMDRRHIVRALIHRERDTSLEAISVAEGILAGTDPVGHDTIINSIHAFNNRLKAQYSSLIDDLNVFYDIMIISSAPGASKPFFGRVQELQKYEEHQKDMVMAFLLVNGMVNEAVVQVMLNEYASVAPDFIARMMAKKQDLTIKNQEL